MWRRRGDPVSWALDLDLAEESKDQRQAFDTDNLTVAVATPIETRRDQLREWTGRELTERTLTGLADIFLFTSADLVSTPPDQLFFHPLWYPVGQTAPLSLLDHPGPVTAPAGWQQRGEAVIVRL